MYIMAVTYYIVAVTYSKCSEAVLYLNQAYIRATSLFLILPLFKVV